MSDETRDILNILKPHKKAEENNYSTTSYKTHLKEIRQEITTEMATGLSFDEYRYFRAKDYILKNPNRKFARVLLQNNENLKTDIEKNKEKKLQR